ncbi:MAG: hypothetical protein LUQ01_01455 [Methanolinea sp.]|nr:hypothetical protein [Methanolinea sp.]
MIPGLQKRGDGKTVDRGAWCEPLDGLLFCRSDIRTIIDARCYCFEDLRTSDTVVDIGEDAGAF